MNPYREIIIRAAGAFLAVIFLTRMVGKSQVGGLTITDWVNGIVVGSIAAGLVTGIGRPASYYVFGLLLFLVFTIVSQWAGLKYRPLHKILSDEPTVVGHNG